MQNGQPYNIPLIVDLHIEKFAGGTVTQYESGATNIVYDQYQDGRWYATQRPAVNQFEDASDTVSDVDGRGCYYWDAVSAKYFVNYDTVYKSSYSSALGNTMSTGKERVFIDQVGDYLVLLDQENDEGWYINSSTSTTLTAISDGDFTGLTLARGGCVLNGKLYVVTTGGDIYESDVEDPTAWGSVNFREAEKEPDDGVYIDKHQDHVVVIGTRSLEFFQDTANPTGSTLTPRTDISYEVGMVDMDAAWRIGDDLYFVGQDRSGAIGVYVLSAFQLVKISGEDMDTFLTSALTIDSAKIVLCGANSAGRSFVWLTLYNDLTNIEPTVTLTYASNRPFWGFWDVQLTGVDYCPVMAWMPSTTTRAGEGILTNGDLITMYDDFNPQDTKGEYAVFESGVFEAGVFTATNASGTAIPFTIVTGVIGAETPRRKRMGDLWLLHTPLETSADVTVSVADEQNATYTSVGTIDVSDGDARLDPLGAYRRRNVKLTGTLSEQLRAERLEATVR